MSQLQSNINLPSLESIDGFATLSSISEVIVSTENELDNFGNAIGNIYNDGDYNNNIPKMINSIGETIGSELSDPAMPFGQSFSNFAESKVLSGEKSAILKLNANISNQIVIQGYDSLNSPTTLYSLATDPYSMSANECYISGRYIIFKDPPYQFTITYDGTYPDSQYIDKDGYMPNIVPNLNNPSSNRPTLTIESGKIKVELNNANAIKSDVSIDDQYGIVLANYLLPFVDATGNTPCPQAYISAYIYRPLSGQITKLKCNNIYILSAESYYLDTSESVDLANDIVIMSITNTTIKEWLTTAIRELENHKHDGMDISSPIKHETLDGILPQSENEDIKYTKSIIPNNDHVQYIHREGYNASDEGAYGNAMLGDLLIGSTSSSSLFNNTLQDSNKILFGSTNGNGHGLYRRSVINGDVLDIASSTNGLLVSYEYNNQYKYGIGISTNSSGIHKFSNRHDNNNLLISSNNDKTTFGKYNNTLESYVLNSVEMGTLDVGIINLNPVSISKNGTNALISSSDANSFLNISTKVGIYNNSISGGIHFTDGTNTFAKIFTSKENGTLSTVIDNKTVFATSSDLYLIKNITDTTAGISLENRANIYVGDVFCYTIGTSKTSGSTKNGFKIGDDHAIYLTENVGPTANTLVLEANNKVIFAKPSLNIEVVSPTYTDIHAGNIIAHGEFSGAIRNESSITDNIEVVDSLTTNAGSVSTFNGTAIFNNEITFNDDVNVGVLKVQNLGTFDLQLNANNASIKNLTTEESTNLKGQIVLSEHVSNPSSFVSNVDSRFNKPVEFVDGVTFTNAVSMTSSLSIGGVLNLISANISGPLTAGSISTPSATITSATITNLNIDTLTANNINTPKFDTDIDGIIITGRVQQIGSSEPNIFQGPMQIYGNIEMASAGQNIKMSNGFIEELQMKPLPDNYDAANVKFVKEEIANVTLSALLAATYPVGTVYTNASNTANPGTLAGPFGVNFFGTWIEYARGRNIIGAGTGTDTRGETKNFLNSETGGEYMHVLTIPEMPTHSHSYNYIDGIENRGSGSNSAVSRNTVSGTTGTTGNSEAHNNIQPYVVASVWVRTIW